MILRANWQQRMLRRKGSVSPGGSQNPHRKIEGNLQVALASSRLSCNLNHMNKLQAIFNSLSDVALKAVVLDLQHQDETGVLPAGPARDLIQRVVDEVNIPFNDAFQIVQHEPIRRAAFKWAKA